MNQSLGPIQLWAISVGLVISGDYFGWNFGWQYANFTEFSIAVGIVAIFYSLFSFSFTELSASLPHSGGPSAYAHFAFGAWGGFLVGFFTLVEFVLAPPAIASALGGYFHYLFPVVPSMIASISFFILLLIINLLGVKQTAKFELFVTVIAVTGLVLYTVSLIPTFDVSKLNFQQEWNFLPILNALPYAIWFFLAVEGVAMSAEEVKNPSRDIPRGYGAGISTLIFFAFTIMFITAGNIDTKTASKLDYPLSYVMGNIFGESNSLVQIFTFIGLFGLIASLMGIILGFSRQIFALAREGYLPKFLAIINSKSFVPSNAVIFGGLIGILALLLGDTDQLITIAAMGACGMYMISMLSFFQLRIQKPEMNRPFRMMGYPILPGISLILSILFFFAMIFLYKKLFLILGVCLIAWALLFGVRTRKKIGRIPKNELSPDNMESALSRADTDF